MENNTQQLKEDQFEEATVCASASTQFTPRQPSTNPFANLSQVDADLALARTLQEQERAYAYMMLRMNNEGSDYGSWETGSYLPDDGDDFDDLCHGIDVDDAEEYDNEDEFDINTHAGEVDNPSNGFDLDLFSSDEAYVGALQEADEREITDRLLAGAEINDFVGEAEYVEEHGTDSQDAWEDVDPDELSYEHLLALGEVVGTESRGLSTEAIACLPSVNYKTRSKHGSIDSCVVCRVDYEDGESLKVLSCKHLYHPECINNWLKIKKVCPVCNTEVSASGSSY